jgi:hypothetical protein
MELSCTFSTSASTITVTHSMAHLVWTICVKVWSRMYHLEAFFENAEKMYLDALQDDSLRYFLLCHNSTCSFQGLRRLTFTSLTLFEINNPHIMPNNTLVVYAMSYAFTSVYYHPLASFDLALLFFSCIF